MSRYLKIIESRIRITGVETATLYAVKPLSPAAIGCCVSTFVHVNGSLVRLLFTNLHTSCPIRILSRVGNKNNEKQRQLVSTSPIFEIRCSKFTSATAWESERLHGESVRSLRHE